MLTELLRATTISSSGLDITIACSDHDTKDAIFDALEVEQNAPTKSHELVAFVALWAVQYAKDSGLDGLHPTHYDLMVKYGARMDSFKRAAT